MTGDGGADGMTRSQNIDLDPGSTLSFPSEPVCGQLSICSSVGVGTAAAFTEYIPAGLALYRNMELIRVTEERIEVDTPPLEETTEGDTP